MKKPCSGKAGLKFFRKRSNRIIVIDRYKDNIYMLCGIEWWAFISKNNAYRIVKLFDLDRRIGSRRRSERRIDDHERSWIRVGKAECFFIELRKYDEKTFELRVRGSLHKFYHQNNRGTFNGPEVLAAIEGMASLFMVEPCEMHIKKLEVGINIPVMFIVFPYLKSNLLYHKKKLKSDFKDKGIGFEFEHDDYIIKIYQKAAHTLRFEIKYTSKEKIQGFGITTVYDLHEATINRLADKLLPELMEVDMRGSIDVDDKKTNPNGLTDKERDKLIAYSSIYYQQSHAEKLRLANDRGDRKRSAALQKKNNRLRKDCREIIRQKGDQVLQTLELKMQLGVELFKNSWADNKECTVFRVR